MSSPVVEKSFVWKFVDQITQGVNKARQAMQEAETTAKEAGMKVSSTSDDWKKMGTEAKQSAEDASQAMSKAKDHVEAMKNAAQESAEAIRGQFRKTTETVNKFPSQKRFNLKATFDDNKLKSFTREITDLPKEKSIWVRIKDGFSDQLKSVQKQVNDTKHSFSGLKDTMAGTFIGGAALGGIYAIGNGLKEAAAAGMEFNTEQQKMQQTWLTLTDSKQAAQGMVDTINDLSVKTGQSRDLVNELEQGFYHLHSSKEESDAMTKSMLNMGDAVGLTSDQMKQVEQDMVHGLATGKVTQGELNQIGMYFPMIDEAMAKHFNTTVKGMREMAHAGKISGEDLEKVFEELGTGKYEKAADNMMQSMWGMERTIKSQAPALIGAFEKPLFNAKNPFYEAVSKWVLDPATQKGFENAGKVLSDIFNGAITGVADVIKPFQGLNKVVGAFIEQFASGAWKGITASFSVIGDAIKAVGKVIEFILTPVNELSKHLNGLGKAKKPIQGLGAAFGAVMGPLIALRGAVAAYNTVLLANAAANNIAEKASKLFAGANKITLAGLKHPYLLAISVAIIAIASAFKLAYDHSTRFRNAINRMAQIVKDLFHGKIGWRDAFKREFDEIKSDFDKFVNLLKGKFGPIGKSIADAFKPIIPVLKTIAEVAAPAVAGLLAFKTVKSLPTVFSATRGGILKLISGIKLIPKATLNALEAIGDFAIKGASKLGELALAGARSMKALATSIVTSVKSIGRAMMASFAANPVAWVVAAVIALGVAFYEAYKKFKPFHDFVNRGLKNFRDGFESLLKDLPKIGKAIGNFFTGKTNWQKNISKKFSDIKKETQKHYREQVKLQQQAQKQQQKAWQNYWSNLSKKSRASWDNLKKHTSSGLNTIRKNISSGMKNVQKTWSDRWDSMKNLTRSVWNEIRKHSSNGMSNIHGAISSGLSTINRLWSNGWNTFSNIFKGIWNGIKQAAQDGMNGVISVINAGIGAIDKVWSFFTGHGTGISKLGKVHFAQGGTVRRHLSVINDGDGPDWKELVQMPDGELFMSQERNWTGFLPEGSRVYSGPETRQIMNTVGVSHYATGGIVGAQHFADGGIIGEGIDWAKGSLENLGSWLGDKLDAIIDFLDDPLKATKGLLEKATSGLYKGLGNFADVAHGATDKLTQPISDWFKKNLEPILDKLEESNPGGAGVARWEPFIKRAAKMEGIALTPTMLHKMLTQINTESGGNPGAIGGTDGLADGHATGLLQFKPRTFRSWIWHGHGNIMNGFDQILAAFNALQHGGEGGWGSFGIPGRGWATGGEITSQMFGWVGDNPEHHEFVLNPYAISAEPLLDKAFEATAQAQPANSSTGNGNSKLDQMIDLLGKVLVAIESQDTNIYMDGENVTDYVSKRQGKTWRLRKN